MDFDWEVANFIYRNIPYPIVYTDTSLLYLEEYVVA